jgi:ABC-type uncharacterized transport system YnjBCD ATPase subunit
VLLAFIQGSRDKVVDETGKLIEGEALSRMKAATMRLVGMLYRNPDWLTRKIYFMESFLSLCRF